MAQKLLLYKVTHQESSQYKFREKKYTIAPKNSLSTSGTVRCSGTFDFAVKLICTKLYILFHILLHMRNGAFENQDIHTIGGGHDIGSD